MAVVSDLKLNTVDDRNYWKWCSYIGGKNEESMAAMVAAYIVRVVATA